MRTVGLLVHVLFVLLGPRVDSGHAPGSDDARRFSGAGTRGLGMGGAGKHKNRSHQQESGNFFHGSGSTFTMEAPWLLPTQNVAGSVEVSTVALRMLVWRGSRYSTESPVLVFTRSTRSVYSVPAHASPYLSPTALYGYVPGVFAGHSLNSF